MANPLEDIQCAGSYTRPHMLDRTDFASWQQRIRLYCRGKNNGVNILKSIDEGPYKMGTFREMLAESTEGIPQFGLERPHVFSDLSSKEKDREMLAESTEGIPQFGLERPHVFSDLSSKEKDRQHKEESIHDYYVRFAKLINDMRNIKMTMSRLQMNSKFVNNMLPEWGRFMTAVKLNRRLRDSNYDQLFAYLKKHETHAKENKMMLERLSQPTVDPLALLSNVSNPHHYSSSSSASSSTQAPPPLANSSSPAEDLIENLTNTLALLTQSYRTFLPQTNNQLQTSSNAKNQATVQDDRVAEDYDAFDSDVDEAPTAQTMFMANLSLADPITDEAGPSYDLDILSEVHDHDQYLDAACTHHEEHVMQDSVQLDHVVDLHADYTSVSYMISYDQYVKDNEVAIGYKNPLCLTRAKQAQPALYNGHEILKDNHAPAKVHNTEDTLEIAEITRKKMNAKMIDPECVTHKVKIATHDYSKENFLATFTPQKQLTPEQIYLSNDLIKLKSKALKEQTKALTREIKEMKDVFEEMEAKVAQLVVDRKHDAIDQKNLLIANDNLIVECLSQEVFSVVTNFELNVAQFAEMHVANTSIQAHCLALEAELANLRDRSHHENQEELINHFSKFEGKDNAIRQLKKQLSQVQVTRSDTERTIKVRTTDSQITKLTDQVTNLQAHNDLFRAENDKVKQHFKELYDSIKITHVEPIISRLRNNRDAHLDYLRHLNDSIETIRDIVVEAKVVRTLDRSIVSVCSYTKHSQELLEYPIGTCSQVSQQRAKRLTHTLLIKKKQVTIAKPFDRQDSNKQVHVVAVKPRKTNVPLPPST
nr:hypothetical protein [Tanacetum cinerariifolium]